MRRFLGLFIALGCIALVGGCGPAPDAAGVEAAQEAPATASEALTAHGRPGFSVFRVPFFVHVNGLPGIWRVATRIYLPHGRVKHRAVQLLLHGATYDGRYWEIPKINGASYSYAADMASRGYEVVVMDQLGAGDSGKPPGDAFGLPQAAQALREVGAQVRLLSGPHHALVYVGHSNGSVTALYSQGTYGGADGVVTTGWVHGYRPLPVDPTDPVFQEALAHPYIALPGEARTGLFYYAPEVDPDVIAYDNAHLNGTMPRQQFLDLLAVHADITARGPGGMTEATRSQQVRVPVLVQAGEEDFAIAPASTVDQPPTEEGFFPNAPSVDVQVLPNIGHAVNGHFTRAESWDGIDGWLQSRFD